MVEPEVAASRGPGLTFGPGLSWPNGEGISIPLLFGLLSIALFPMRREHAPCKGGGEFTKEMNYAYGFHFLDE